MERRRQSTTRGGMVKTSLTFAPGLLDQIDRRANARRLSRSGYVSEMVEKGMEQEREEEAQKRVQREAVPA